MYSIYYGVYQTILFMTGWLYRPIPLWNIKDWIAFGMVMYSLYYIFYLAKNWIKRRRGINEIFKNKN